MHAKAPLEVDWREVSSYFRIHHQDDSCFCCPDFSLSWSHRQASQSVVAVFGSLRPNLKEIYSWQLSSKYLSLLGISIGAITALVVTVITYGFFQTIIFPSIDSKVISNVPNAPQGLFSYWVPPAFMALQSSTIVSAIARTQPQFQLRFVEPLASKSNSHTGIDMLLAGELSFVQSSQPLRDADFFEAKARGFTLEQIPVAIDGIAFYVNPQVSIPGLSLSQLKDIFAGKITNWRQVGGPDLPITPFYTFDQSGRTSSMLKEKVLHGEKLGTNVQAVSNLTESISKVTQTAGGIGYATVSEVAGQHDIYLLPLSQSNGQAFMSPYLPNQTALNNTALLDGSYFLTTKLFVIFRKDGTIDEQAGLAYTDLLLSDRGQQLIDQAGFVPIR